MVPPKEKMYWWWVIIDLAPFPNRGYSYRVVKTKPDPESLSPSLVEVIRVQAWNRDDAIIRIMLNSHRNPPEYDSTKVKKKRKGPRKRKAAL